jgi:homoserine kinase
LIFGYEFRHVLKSKESRADMEQSKPDPGVSHGWRAVVPATSANLGCAFDCGGLALKLHLKALFVPCDTPKLTIEYAGQTPERFPLDSSNLMLQALRFAAERLGARPPGGHLLAESEIPIGVGLGSSAAAVVAGLLLGSRYSGKDPAAEQLLRWAEELEGHIDNAAAAYHGGLVLALCNNMERVVTAKTAFPESIRVVVVSPAVAVSTREARQVLPKSYERDDVLHTLQRTALLAATCFSGEFGLFPELFDDKLHHPFRQKLSVIAFAVKDEVDIAQALQKIFSEEGVSSEARFTSADNHGAWVTREAVPLAERLGRVLQRVEKVE